MSQLTDMHPVNPRRMVKMSAVTRTRRKEEVVSRLQRHIDLASAQLEKVKKEQEEYKAAAKLELKADNRDEVQRKKFDEHILE